MHFHKMFFMGAFCMFFLPACQVSRFTYYMKRYDGNYRKELPSNAIQLDYRIEVGRQTIFYIPSRLAPRRPPDRLWMLYGGNGTVALEWLDLIRDAADPRAGYLLMDYPGAGLCQGYPNADTIGDSSEGAIKALSDHYGVSPQFFEGKLNLLGHSLGCALAVQMAPLHRVARVILLAPFTNMRDAAAHIVGWPLCQFVPDLFDNEAGLGALYLTEQRPVVVILHGVHDNVVPVTMGRRLAARYPDWIDYHELPEASHKSFMDSAKKAVLTAMFPAEAGKKIARSWDGGSANLKN